MASKNKVCTSCEKIGVMKTCSRCKNIQYCSKECQKNDWVNHRKICKKVKVTKMSKEPKVYTGRELMQETKKVLNSKKIHLITHDMWKLIQEVYKILPTDPLIVQLTSVVKEFMLRKGLKSDDTNVRLITNRFIRENNSENEKINF
jgi:hypothetical protein